MSTRTSGSITAAVILILLTVYNFRFRTSSSDWISASSGVNLTVTELQMKVDRETAGQRKVKLTCSSTCRLNEILTYDWYRKGEYMPNTRGPSIVLDSTSSSDEGSYYCGLSDSSGKFHRSPSVCVLGKECWGVSYTPEHVCALKGSSVDLSCSYYPGGHTVTKSVWFIKQQAGAEPVDVREDEEYQGRVQYRQSSQNDCSMRITHLRERDAQTYRFRFYTDGGEYTGQPGVTLSVTGLKVTVSDTDSGGKKLNCSSTCTLPNNLTYIWYKNGQPVIHCKSASCSVAAVSGAVSYSCAVEGHESLVFPPVYSSVITVGAVVFLGVVVFLALILITGALCMWRKKSHSSSEEKEQCVSATVYGVVSALAMTSDPTSREISDDQDDNHLSRVYFRPSHSQEEPPFLTAKLPPDSTEEEGVQYAAVKFSRHTAAPQSLLTEAADDPSQTYSQIQKQKPAT